MLRPANACRVLANAQLGLLAEPLELRGSCCCRLTIMATRPLSSFVHVPDGSHFSMQNLPYGVFRPDAKQTPRPGIAIGEYVLDLRVISEAGLFSGPLLSGSDCFQQVCRQLVIF